MDIRLLAPIATLCMGTIGVIVSTTLWWLNKQRKHLTIFTIHAEPLIAMKGLARRKLKVRFGDRAVENTHLLHLSLRNDGNVPVAASDYQSPIRIELNADAQILEVDIIETWPADLERRIASTDSRFKYNSRLIKEVADSAVELTPVLLNSRDEIVLQLLVENYGGYINVSQHVTGVKRVDAWSESRLLPRTISASGAAIVIFAAFFLAPDEPFNLTIPSIPYVIVVLLGIILYAAGLLWPRSERTREFSDGKTAVAEAEPVNAVSQRREHEN
ncbi:MAG TPA: hypothetical protein V6C72_20140 [Chroococcales cyanobacterium]